MVLIENRGMSTLDIGWAEHATCAGMCVASGAEVVPVCQRLIPSAIPASIPFILR